MLRRETARSYQEFSDEEEEIPDVCQDDGLDDLEPDGSKDMVSEADDEMDDAVVSNPLMWFDKACLKNIFSMVLLLVYLMLTTVAAFLAYQTITDFMKKLNHPVMSVSYKEVGSFEPAGISLYLKKAQLLSCKHYHHDHIPPLVSPGKPEKGDCVTQEVIYTSPYSNHTMRRALVVQGPTDVRNRELIFLQLSQNETEEDFSAISYMLFAKFNDLNISRDKATFMQDCERNYSMWTFSGGFRTWVKMSLVKTYGKAEESVEFRQESSVVKYNDKRNESERTNQLFFVVFEWRDPFIQEVRDAANFAKLSIKWMIKIRRRHLKRREKEMKGVS
ncbi:hypothetical protein JZ751_013848 [Albula glossodonta]|uniref:Proton-activated chloride channel n=1 Tax=Albula glossodonta TaxID=121402 RepID=A0A8T2MLT4_9TELE|nr:hypothetical protein JZ751_013848 [Albula glossodonta]